MRPIRRALVAGLAVALLVPAVSRAQSASRAPSGPTLVFAAASLKEALDAVADAWARQGGVRPTLSYGATSALARQIEQGAPADVVIAADNDWMDYLAERRLVRPESRARLLGNSLVLVAPAARPVALKVGPGFALAAALGDGRLAVADVRAVPAGRYARAALEHLGVWQSVQPRLAMAQDVRAALALVARGEVPLGIVYATDARAEPRVGVVDVFPSDSHPPIEYPVALTVASRAPDAGAFVAFLRSPAAAAIFVAHGFTTTAP